MRWGWIDFLSILYIYILILINRENAGAPTNGAVITQKAGKVIWRDIWVAYGMANPSANGHNLVDQVNRQRGQREQSRRVKRARGRRYELARVRVASSNTNSFLLFFFFFPSH